ncbi:AarF/ABC1/UbiB kinase family protein [Janibacter sp. YIM B02568]|uniref:ABC1 kinase family protein n=1 Tax=Janibacter endophyticus TaxID=2806261 RepID=UPI0019508258|nr:AarF/UbiB family protein [Janibacter endophyticus]MBM6544864.1 AarF/ABC1/UbiB kinase family protein [Janibacter endophyticus]
MSSYTDLVRLLLRYGRTDLLAGAQLDEFAIGDDAVDAGSEKTAQAFAADLEAMGPTYIKMGQLLSTRFDLLPPAYTEALTRLQDTVQPFPFEEVREIVESELGARIKDIFADFDEEPLAAASLGQVHRATTRTGRDVVVKVQRPDVRDTIRDDMEVLGKVTQLADRRTSVGRSYGLNQLLGQFRRSLVGELDYRREAKNLLRFVELTRDYERLVVPEPLLQLTTSRVLTMEHIEGRKVTDLGPLALMDIEARPIVEQLFRCYLRMILDDGVLHADPHPGNLLVTDDGRLALLDLGMIATVPDRVQTQVVKLLLAISDGDGEECAQVLAEMGHPLEDYDAASFREDVAHLVSEAVASGADMEAGRVLVDLSRVSGLHGLRPPAEMSMIGKALLNLDQATAHLDPTFAPAEAIRDNVSEIFAASLKTSPGGILAAAIEAKEFTALLPKRANRILDAVSQGELRVQVDAIDEQRLHLVLQRVANRLTLGLIIAATIIGAAMMMRVETDARIFGFPAIAMVFFTIAVVAAIALGVQIVLTDRKLARTHRPSSDEHL